MKTIERQKTPALRRGGITKVKANQSRQRLKYR